MAEQNTPKRVKPKVMERAADIIKEQQDFGADWTMDDLQEDFVLLGFDMSKTSHGPCVILICERDGEEHRAVTWSKPIIEQTQQLYGFPLLARIDRKRGQHGYYYTYV